MILLCPLESEIANGYLLEQLFLLCLLLEMSSKEGKDSRACLCVVP